MIQKSVVQNIKYLYNVCMYVCLCVYIYIYSVFVWYIYIYAHKLYIYIYIYIVCVFLCVYILSHTFYIYIYICIFRQHFFVNANFIKHNRHFMSTYFLLDPFEFLYYFYCILGELIYVLSIVACIPSTY